MNVTIRAVLESDLAELLRLQVLAYGDDFLESSNVFHDKIQQGMPSSFVVAGEQPDSPLFGYCLSHPYPLNQVPALNRLLSKSKVKSASHWYLHDLALSPTLRGQGVAQQLVANVIDYVKKQRCESIGLVAVQNSVEFWQRFGFVVLKNQPDLSSYGEDARYMVKTILD